MSLKYTASLFFILLLTASHSIAQVLPFERKVTSAGNIGLSITNYGVIGKADVRNLPSGDPSFSFPRNSGQEHLFEAGLWLGAFYNGELRVSTAAVDNPSGYQTRRGGYEFTPVGTPFTERSSLVESPLFSPSAISHQDFVVAFTDRNTTIQDLPIANHIAPLFAHVISESYNWNFSFTESFSIIKYSIRNDSDVPWDSVHVGMYGDLVNRNVNSTLEQGSAFFNKNGIGYIDSLYTTYVFDAGSTDTPSLNTYAGITILGSEYRNLFYHPSNEAYLTTEGSRIPVLSPSYWFFGSGSGDFAGPRQDDANIADQDRFQRMSSVFPIDRVVGGGQSNREILRTAGVSANGNFISLISMGPFRRVNPGESFTVYFAFVGGLKPDPFTTGSGAAKSTDTPVTRQPFKDNIGWAFRTFYGEDANGNGVLDDGEDLNGNGRLDRFLIPEPPAVPGMRVELESNKATLYWDRRAEFSVDPVSGEMDFEGYRIYRTNLGDDLRGQINTNRIMVAEFDSAGNDFGNNTGFGRIELDAPVLFTGDPTEYWYKYEFENLLSGWQYAFSVTAFDKGSSVVEIESLESSPNANLVRVFPGSRPVLNFKDGGDDVGVYPNPYRVNAAWDGNNELTRKLIFYNLPARAEIRVYTLAGEIVAELRHEAGVNTGNTRWFNDFSAPNRIQAGGEYAWDILTQARQNLTSGLYLFTVKDMESNNIQRGKFVIIK